MKTFNLYDTCGTHKYIIQEDGTIYSMHLNRTLTPHPNNSGYLHSRLFGQDGKMRPVHRIVAEAFIPNPQNLSDVNHKNGIKTDNRVENLEWMSHSDNLKHARQNGHYKNYSPIDIDLASEICEAYATGMYSISEISRGTGRTRRAIAKLIKEAA